MRRIISRRSLMGEEGTSLAFIIETYEDGPFHLYATYKNVAGETLRTNSWIFTRLSRAQDFQTKKIEEAIVDGWMETKG